ncbi:MAG TPA: hypothetical protein VNJ08_06535 [Bacteriovoracaceae bacterium]|nr:hypothetical protein [Bacteriovoracaceae bacterium]
MNRKQLELNLFQGKHGGRRQGAGRKRIYSSGVAHRKRERVSFRTPLHINFKYKVTVRNKMCLRILKRAILGARKHGLKVIHFSLQTNHIHLIVETTDNETLSTGMRSLTVTLAKGIGKGKVQLSRYHLHVLKSLRETRNAILYVLFNEQKHSGARLSIIDSFSSLLSHPKAICLIRKFAIKEKVSLIMGKGDDFIELSLARSFLTTKAIEQLLFE